MNLVVVKLFSRLIQPCLTISFCSSSFSYDRNEKSEKCLITIRTSRPRAGYERLHRLCVQISQGWCHRRRTLYRDRDHQHQLLMLGICRKRRHSIRRINRRLRLWGVCHLRRLGSPRFMSRSGFQLRQLGHNRINRFTSRSHQHRISPMCNRMFRSRVRSAAHFRRPHLRLRRAVFLHSRPHRPLSTCTWKATVKWNRSTTFMWCL